MKRLLIIFSFLALASHPFAAPVVSNVAFVQQADGDGGTEVVVTYDLVSPEGPAEIRLIVSDDAGASFDIVPHPVAGDVGDAIAPGVGKQIVWDIGTDRPNMAMPDARLRVLALDDAPPSTGGLRWSNPATWGGVKPIAGDDVTIPAGWNLILDEDTPALGGLQIDGTLEFERMDVNLTAEWIMVHGTLRVGTEAQPFTHHATITLTDPNTANSIMGMGTRGIMVMSGTLDLHGLAPVVPWTKLNAHASAGATALTLADNVDWSVGDEIIVAPTDYFNVAQTERRTLSFVSGDALEISTPLTAFRWGLLQYATANGLSLTPENMVVPAHADTPTVLDERAEVANLTRNIVIQAPDDPAWQTQGFGAHVMIMGTGAEAFVEGVEFRRGGQRDRLGRYPFHWHMLSYDGVTTLPDATGQYVRKSTIHESANRGIVIHGTNGVVVQDNVVFDVRGHGIFTEDAVERRNLIDGNIVLRVRNPAPADALKLHEYEAPGNPSGGSSGFWLSNPDNVVINNTAADAEGFGFWLAYPENPWGESIGIPMRPNRLRFDTFADNTTHSNRFDGIRLDDVEISNAGAVFPIQYSSTTNGQEPDWQNTTRLRFTLDGYTTWKNGRSGIWDRAVWPNNWRVVSADNCGRFFAGSGADGLIERSLIVGTSLNNFSPRPQSADTLGGNETPAAFATYHSSFDIRDNIVMHFPLGNVRAGATSPTRSGAYATEDYYVRGVDKGQMRNAGNMLIESHPGYKFASMFPHYVLAGALWDPHGSWGPANNYFVYDNPFFTHGQTITPVVGGADANGVSVPGPFYSFNDFVINNGNAPWEDIMAIDVTRLDPSLAPVGTWNVTAAGATTWLLGHMRHFAAHASGIFRLEFPGLAAPTDFSMTFENMLEPADTIVVGVEFSGAVSPNVYVFTPGFFRVYTELGSLQAVRDSAGETWWQDTTNNMVWVKLRGGFWQFWTNDPDVAVPSSDDLLYETTTLHINTD